MHKIYYGNSTDNLHECYNKRSEENGHNLRNYKKSFQYNGGLIWNSISKEIRLTSTLNIFKIKLKASLPSLLNKCNI